MNEQKPKSMIEIIKEAGYVMVVRCKDCIYWQRIKLSYGIVRNGTCTNHRQSVCTTKEDWFCADGRERKVSE